MPSTSISSTDRKPKRWGLRTLALLALALLSMLVSEIQGHYTVLSLAGLLIGLIGALICSIRGLASTL
jgi:nitrate/nitrite transporter NarK